MAGWQQVAQDGSYRVYTCPMCITATLRNEALEMAYYLHGDKETASLIAKRALDAFSIEKARMIHRLDYFFIRRRSKPALSDAQLLQKLIYDKSAEIEIHLFKSVKPDLSPERLRIFFIKFLVWRSLQYNAKHTIVAICRLLFEYQPRIVQEILTTVTHANLDIDSAIIRINKGRLMDELIKHFGSLLVEMQGVRNERCFMPDPAALTYWTQVREYLNFLLPWETGPCLSRLPDLSKSEISRLQSENLYQSHVIICPECLSNIIAYLGRNRLEHSLTLPLFHINTL